MDTTETMSVDDILECSLINAHIVLEKTGPLDENYPVILERVQKLEKLAADRRPKQLSPDTRAISAANLAGIALIISHERLNVITTKATSLLLKLR